MKLERKHAGCCSPSPCGTSSRLTFAKNLSAAHALGEDPSHRLLGATVLIVVDLVIAVVSRLARPSAHD